MVNSTQAGIAIDDETVVETNLNGVQATKVKVIITGGLFKKMVGRRAVPSKSLQDLGGWNPMHSLWIYDSMCVGVSFGQDHFSKHAYGNNDCGGLDGQAEQGAVSEGVVGIEGLSEDQLRNAQMPPT